MSDMADDHNHIEELVVGHFDGTLCEERERQLAAALAVSDSAKRLFLSYMRMEGRLHSLGRDGFLREPTAEFQETVPQSADTTPVNQKAPEARRFWHSRTWTASTSLAICVVVVVTWLLWPSTVSAGSVLERAQRAAAELVDRTYRLVIAHSDAEGGPVTRELRIAVRGGGRFVMQPEDGAYAMGSDGTDFWIARRNGPVFITHDFRALTPKLQRRIPNRRLLDCVLASPDEPLLLDISGLLLLIESKYDVRLVDSTNPAEHHVRATRRPDVRGGPSTITLRTESNSGVVTRAKLTFENSRQRTWELIETSTLSDRWYHYSQHAPGRRVERLDAEH